MSFGSCSLYKGATSIGARLVQPHVVDGIRAHVHAANLPELVSVESASLYPPFVIDPTALAYWLATFLVLDGFSATRLPFDRNWFVTVGVDWELVNVSESNAHVGLKQLRCVAECHIHTQALEGLQCERTD